MKIEDGVLDEKLRFDWIDEALLELNERETRMLFKFKAVLKQYFPSVKDNNRNAFLVLNWFRINRREIKMDDFDREILPKLEKKEE